MKRFVCCFLIVCLFLSISACSGETLEQCSFYYLRQADDIVYGAADGIMVSEERSLSPTQTDLDYLLHIYLGGPISDSLQSPFPKGTFLLSTLMEGDVLTIVLSSEFTSLSGIHLTLAAACLSSTCFALTDARTLCIRSGDQTYTYLRDSFLYLDSSALPTE